MLKDDYNRPLTHLRISITHKCNYKCIFCHREGETPSEDFLTVDDIALVAEASRKLGIRFYKLTGGEPLIREDIVDTVRILKDITKEEVSITTNGYFLKDLAGELVNAGLNRVNVSLHSLKDNVYAKITSVNALDRVLEGLKILRDYGIPVKLNVVVVKYNLEELFNIIDFASSNGFDLNVIELIPVNVPENLFDELHVSIDGIEGMLSRRAVKRYTRQLQARPVYVLDSGIKVELVKSFCNPVFCSNCTKIRLTHDGMFKPCIMRSNNLVDIRHILRSNLSYREKIDLIVKKIIETNKKRAPYFQFRGNSCVSIDGRYYRKGDKL